MRKTLLVIAALFTTAQVFAANVTLSISDEGDGWAAIRYSADANVSGFGLKVTADSGVIFIDIKDYNVGECTASQKGYGIFPGTIDINEAGVVVDDGTPVAPNTAPGANDTGLNTDTLILEMGALYVEGNEPPTSGTLALVQVNGNCQVCVEGEPIRGNVVLTDSTMVDPCMACASIVAFPCIVPDVVGEPNTDAQSAIVAAGFTVGNITTASSDPIPYDCVISTNPTAGAEPGCGTAVDMVVSEGSDCYFGQPDEDEWIAVNRPTCWCYPRQCHGDADGKSQGKDNYWVSTDDLTIMLNAWQIPNGPVTVPGICADAAHDKQGKDNYRVGTNDLTILLSNWQIPNGPAGDCAPGNRTP